MLRPTLGPSITLFPFNQQPWNLSATLWDNFSWCKQTFRCQHLRETTAQWRMMRRLRSRRKLGVFPLDGGFSWELLLAGEGVRQSPEQTAITAVVWLCRVRHSLAEAAESQIRNILAGLRLNIQHTRHTTIQTQRKRAATQSSAGPDSNVRSSSKHCHCASTVSEAAPAAPPHSKYNHR